MVAAPPGVSFSWQLVWQRSENSPHSYCRVWRRSEDEQARARQGIFQITGLPLRSLTRLSFACILAARRPYYYLHSLGF